MKKIFSLVLVALVTGCTENASTRQWGGDMTIKLPPGKKLENLTWKENSLWILSRNLRPGEIPENYTFKENSPLGLVEGTVTIVEQ
jgi:hypothetical protein